VSDKPLAYIDTDGAVTFRASGIGKCSRALWASLNEISSIAPTERLEVIFAEGHLHEQAVREVLESEGAELSPQEEITLWIIPGVLKIVGHVDGDIINWNQVWENKALGREGFRRFKNVGFDAHPEYPWQIATYMHALDKPALYTIKNRDDGELIRLVIDKPPVSLDDIKAKAIGVFKAYEAGIMPACDPERFLCSFYFLHDELEEDEPIQTIEDPYIEAAAGALAEIREQEKYLKEKKDELREDILKLPHGIHEAGDFRITIKSVTSNRIDYKKMIDAGLNPDEYKSPSESTRVEIKPAKGGKK
jgi:hypothetical protein